MIHVPPDVVGSAVYSIVGHVQSSGHVPLAYIDPGTGSMFIQAALAGALTLPFVLRSKVRAVVGHISRRRTHSLVVTKSRPVLR